MHVLKIALRGIVLVIILLLNSLSWAAPSFFDDVDDAILTESLLASMSAREILSQVFFLGYIGVTPSDNIKKWIEERQIGGVKIFTRNVADLPTLAQSIKEMQELSLKGKHKIPLFIATDQEGGWVRHIKHETSETPGNLALGASGLPRDAFLTGYYIGQELKALGINMNFSPTADVYSNPYASVIGPRAFSADPITTALLSVAYFKGMSKAGIIATAKHFPGHGDASKDSHGHLPVIQADLEVLWNRELVPYRFLIKEGLPAIMTAHLAFPQILNDMTASSVSPYFQRNLLREKMKFNGVTITDDMEMAGVLKGNGNIITACKLALESGNDMILISHTPLYQEKTWSYLLDLMQSDTEFREYIEEAVKRIITLKLKTFKGNNPFPLIPDMNELQDLIPNRDALDFFFESACRSITAIRSEEIPYSPQKEERLLLIGQFDAFFSEALARYPQADTFKFDFNPFYTSKEEDRKSVPALATAYDTIIFCVANFNSLDVLNTLRELDKRIIVISALSPVYLMEAMWVETAIAIYGISTSSFRAGIAALSGDFKPEGRLPINFFTQQENQ